MQSNTDTTATDHETVRAREIAGEQRHLDTVYHRLEEKLAEAEYILEDAAKRVHVGTPGALAERDAQVYRAGAHLQRLNNEFEDFLFGRVDLQQADAPEEHGIPSNTPLDPADPAVAESLHIGRLGVLDAEFGPLVIDWRAPAAAPFYRSTPLEPGRVLRRRVIRSKGRKVIGVEDDLLRPDLTPTLDGEELPVVGDGALMASLGRARSHSMRDIVSSIQKEQDEVIRAAAAGATLVTGGPGTGKTAVALHRAAFLLYQDRRRYAGGILVVSPTPLLVSYTEGVLPSLGEEGQVAIRAVGSLVDGIEAGTYDTPRAARIKGSARMVQLLRRAARATLELRAPQELKVVARGEVLRLDAGRLRTVRGNVVGSGGTPLNLLRPRARRLLLDALWQEAVRDLPRPADHYARERRQEEKEAFDEYVSDEAPFLAFLDAWWPAVTPRRVLGTLKQSRHTNRIARGAITPEESKVLAASWRHLSEHGEGELSAHDVALVDELQLLLGEPARPKFREVDAADLLTGLDEVTTFADRNARQREVPAERTEYAHVIVDESQDLTPMQWRMIGRRARTATWTIVGDPAQSSWPFPQEAQAALDEVLSGKPRRRYTLTVNYRNPAEIAEVAAKVLALAAPGTPSPSAVRHVGVEPRFAAVTDPSPEVFGAAARAELELLLGEVDGTVALVVPMDRRAEAARWTEGLGERVVTLGSLEAKGLEYDATVVADPTGIAGESEAGLRVLYVALTRATQRLTVLSGPDDLPDAAGTPALLRG
ncbi:MULTISPECIES: UvrD-helicase domain-containing protein [unclassified Streptomyces]|uniref:HelD family protein n=1 Tax=unclassified Streptomyces TaxID=2593676 RepID=UPI0005F9025C|nr:MULTISPECIES: UvrD-helicase domain-containing protein [unclassified Streptomyces]KJY38215.1 helicase [Streptomyces sp. NRRL S-495]KOV26426.1 helicase [Streptomyces sp. XY431]